MREIRQHARNLGFDQYIYHCWEYKTAKSEEELLEAVEQAFQDICWMRNLGYITRTSEQIDNEYMKVQKLKIWKMKKDLGENNE